jgi:hypothetical protein
VKEDKCLTYNPVFYNREDNETEDYDKYLKSHKWGRGQTPELFYPKCDICKAWGQNMTGTLSFRFRCMILPITENDT